MINDSLLNILKKNKSFVKSAEKKYKRNSILQNHDNLRNFLKTKENIHYKAYQKHLKNNKQFKNVQKQQKVCIKKTQKQQKVCLKKTQKHKK